MNRRGCFEICLICQLLLPIILLYFLELNTSEQLARDLHGFFPIQIHRPFLLILRISLFQITEVFTYWRYNDFWRLDNILLCFVCGLKEPDQLVVIKWWASEVAQLKMVALWKVVLGKVVYLGICGRSLQMTKFSPTKLPLPLSCHLTCFSCYSPCHPQQKWDHTNATHSAFQNWWWGGLVNKHSLLLKLASLGIFWYNAKTHTCCNLVFLFLYHQLFFTSVKFVYIWIYENQYLFIFSVLSCLKAKTISLGWVSKHCGIVHTGEQWKQ